jgi:hypothetical protein
MAVRRADFDIAKGHFFSLDIAAAKGNGDITVIAVTILGIRGSKSAYRRIDKVEYRLLADVSDLSAGLPETWIVSPQADQIEHVNIFTPSLCPLTNTRLPYICWGNGDSRWLQASPGHRTLGNYLEAARQVLGSANLNSPAR